MSFFFFLRINWVMVPAVKGKNVRYQLERNILDKNDCGRTWFRPDFLDALPHLCKSLRSFIVMSVRRFVGPSLNWFVGLSFHSSVRPSVRPSLNNKHFFASQAVSRYACCTTGTSDATTHRIFEVICLTFCL